MADFVDNEGRLWRIDFHASHVIMHPRTEDTAFAIRRIAINQPDALPALFGNRKYLSATVQMLAVDSDGRLGVEDPRLKMWLDDPTSDAGARAGWALATALVEDTSRLHPELRPEIEAAYGSPLGMNSEAPNWLTA